MNFNLNPYKGISDTLTFGIERKVINKKMIELGITPDPAGGGDREYIEELDLIIHYSKNGKTDGFEFFMDNNIDMKFLYNEINLFSFNYEQLYKYLTEEDYFVIRLNDQIISFGLGITAGFSSEKNGNIESIFIINDKKGYKKIIVDQIQEFY